MSQQRGGPLVRHLHADKSSRPSLDRPSLFAGMEDEGRHGEDSDLSRVGILSALATARRPARKPTFIQGITLKKRRGWPNKLLVGLMLLGVLSLLASVVMLLTDWRHDPASTDDSEARPEASRLLATRAGERPDNPLSALIAPPHNTALMPQPAEPAVIENVLSTTAAVREAAAAARTAAPSTTDAALPAPEATAAPAPPAEQPGPDVNAPPPASTQSPKQAAPSSPAAASSRTPAPRAGAPASTTPNTRPALRIATPSAPAAAHRQPQVSPKNRDEDVALLEAMFAHTHAHQAPASVAKQIQSECGGFTGAKAATCRARICVQNPTAPACHQD